MRVLCAINGCVFNSEENNSDKSICLCGHVEINENWRCTSFVSKTAYNEANNIIHLVATLMIKPKTK